MNWFDAHLDLAYLAVSGRDMGATLDQLNAERAKKPVGPHPPAAVTLPSLRAGGVHHLLGTIFTETNGVGPDGYPADDVEAAHEAGLRQLRVYQNWAHDSGVVLSRFDDEPLDELRVSAEDPTGAERAYKSRTTSHDEQSIRLGILIENADPIRSPDELPWWLERGVVAIGMAWWTSSRYAGGNGVDTGLTDMGRELARAMDAHNVVHDLSHLSQRSSDELLVLTDRPVIASHSNSRVLLGGEANEHWQRHLSDETIKEIAARGGVIGLNLCMNFLRHYPGGEDNIDRMPTIDEALAHVERICDIAGHRQAVGLGSDMDGGFSAKQMCVGVEKPADLDRLAEALAAKGWSDDEVAGFAYANWMRFFAAQGRRG